MSGYLEFANAVPFRDQTTYYETALRKADGSTNKGQFGRAVRLIPAEEYQLICNLGFAETRGSIQAASAIAIEEAPLIGRTDRVLLVERPFRDAAFTRVVQKAYDKTCAMTGLKLVNGGGRCEIEAAHIIPVAERGSDSPRNGLALSRTVHWMFDRGILSVSDSGQILMAPSLVPEPIKRMLNPDGQIKNPENSAWTPHRDFLRYHREKLQGLIRRPTFFSFLTDFGVLSSCCHIRTTVQP
jgi:putative restriction endonuclease